MRENAKAATPGDAGAFVLGKPPGTLPQRAHGDALRNLTLKQVSSAAHDIHIMHSTP